MGSRGNDQFTKLMFESGYKFSVPVDTNVSVEVVVRKNLTQQETPRALYYKVHLF